MANVGTEWASRFGQNGMPVKAAKELGGYINLTEARIAEMERRIEG